LKFKKQMSNKSLLLSQLLLMILFNSCTSVEYNILTGKENLSFISEEKEVKLGKKFARQVEREFEIIKDPHLRDPVNRVGYNLVKSCDRKEIVYHFNVIDKMKNAKNDENNESPNAFALPGGYIYINKMLLDMLQSDDEIAAVLAHELSHIVLRHNILKLQESIGIQALMVILGTNAPDARTAKNSRIALILLSLAYSKEREFEADRLALKYMQKTGYNPNAMITLLKKLQKFQFASPIRRYYLKTHPYLDERIEQVKKELKTEKNILY